MALDDKILLIADGHELIGGKTDIDIHDTVALGASEVVMVLAAIADPVVMCSIRKINPGEQAHIHQLFNRTVDRGAPNAWLGLSKLLPEALDGEIGATAGEFDQSVRDEFARTRVTLAYLVESRVNFICYHHPFLMRFRLSSY